jgi:iron(III) transport system ATP-binding protein
VADLLRAAGITTILVTHDQAEALSFADQVAVMHEGALLQVGAPRELYMRPKNAMVANFLGEAIILSAQAADGFAECALGRLRVRDRGRQGRVEIMLRPEQVLLTRASREAASDPAKRIAEVTGVDFGGAACSVTVRLLNGATAHTGAPLELCRSYVEAPRVGDVVHIEIVGEAHVFAEPGG